MLSLRGKQTLWNEHSKTEFWGKKNCSNPCIANYRCSKIKMQNNKYLIIGFANVCANGSESDLASVQVNGRLSFIFTRFWLDFGNRFCIPAGFFKGGY